MKASIERLRAELRADRASIARWLDQLGELDLGPTSDPATLSLAAWALHHAYSAVEAILERVMRVIEDSHPEDPGSHRAILDVARLEIEGIRPPLLRADTVHELHELRAFRHFVRHAYAVSLDGVRLAELQTRTRRLRPALDVDLDQLDRWLAAISRTFDESETRGS